MNKVIKIFKVAGILGLLAVVLVLVLLNYSYIFSRRVVGVIENVERINLNVSLMQGASEATDKINRELFSFAVAIKDSTGEIVTASADDRQWAVAQSGQCAEAQYYPYPPWNLKKSGTYFGARLLKLSDCRGK